MRTRGRVGVGWRKERGSGGVVDVGTDLTVGLGVETAF